MPFSQKLVVTIQFAETAPFLGKVQPDDQFANRNIQLVESISESIRIFTLSEGDKPEYVLRAEETETLIQMLSQIEISAPWKGLAGFDGTDYVLTLLGAMSSITFSWWVDAPAEWEQAGEVFNYVLEIADRA